MSGPSSTMIEAMSPVESAALAFEPLARHRGRLPLVRQWFVGEWPAWYGTGGPGDVDADLDAYAASDDRLPLGLLAFEGGLPVGIGAIKTEAIPGHEHLGPWAGAGFVLPSHRGRGIGAALLAALAAHARRLGHPALHCGTSTSDSLLKRCGWQAVEMIVHDRRPLTIYRSPD